MLVQPDTPTPAATATATATPTATITSTATATPTQTPRPTFTPAPTATPVPRGYYAHPTAGYSFILPQGFDLREELADAASFSAADGELNLLVYAAPANNELSFEQQLADFRANARVPNNWRTEIDEVEIGPLGPMPSATITGFDGLQTFVLRFILISDGRKEFAIVISGPAPVYDDNILGLERMFATFSAGEAVFGYARSETLILRGFLPSSERDIDPALGSGSAASYKGMLFAGLVRLSPDLRIVPDLAERWEVSPAADVYTFTMRADAAFASGQPITADDVAYSWERVLDPQTGADGAATYLGDIAGAQARLDGQADRVSGIEAVDRYTLVVRLNGPNAAWLAKLTYPVTFVVDSNDVQGRRNWYLSPNASGPYQIREIREGQAIVFERNPYYAPAAGVRYVAFRSSLPGTGLEHFLAGDLDLAGLSDEELALVRDPAHPAHPDLQTVTGMCTAYLQLDVNQPPFDSVDARRALALATDRTALLATLSSADLPAQTMLPPGMPGFVAPAELPAFDPIGARRAWAQAGQPSSGATVSIVTSGVDDDPGPLVTALAGLWREVLGVEARVIVANFENFAESLRAAEAQVVVGAWCADYPDPSNFLDVLFRSGMTYNYTGFSDPEIDALLDQALVEFDPVQRLNRYQEIETRLLDQVVVIPLSHTVFGQLIDPRVLNYTAVPIGVAQYQLLALTP
jgi:ABC-type transport system substrate-binding protein